MIAKRGLLGWAIESLAGHFVALVLGRWVFGFGAVFIELHVPLAVEWRNPLVMD